MLEGKQFFSFEVADLVTRAADKAFQAYVNTKNQVWSADATRLMSLRSKIDALATEDANSGHPSLYQRGSNLWGQLDVALAPFAGDAEVVGLVAGLPVDVSPFAGFPGWFRPVLLVGGLSALALFGYRWVKGK